MLHDPRHGLFRTIGGKSVLLFLALAIIGAGSTTITYYQIDAEARDGRARDVAEMKATQRMLELVRLQKDIQLDVVQVQQFLTDFGATRGLGGSEEDFAKAAEFADRFGQDVARARSYLDVLDAPASIRVLNDLEREFPSYYEMGIRMARTYGAQGTEAGNSIMSQFDERSELMQKHLEALSGLLASERDKYTAGVQSARKQSQERFDVLIAVSIVSVILTFLSCLLAWIAVRQWLVKPLVTATQELATLAEGRNSNNLAFSGRQDELGELARAYNRFVQLRKELDAERLRAEENDRQRQEERRIQEQKKSETDQQLIRTLQGLADRVEGAARQSGSAVIAKTGAMTELMSALSKSASELKGNSSGVACAAEQTLAAMRQTASTTAQLSRTIKDVAERADSASEANLNAVEATQSAGGRIQTLAQTVSRIEAFTETINDIARKTNLLALNAGVEAARSGDHGLGFAVIAREVKALSEQTSQATAEISGLITGIQQAKDHALKAVSEINQAIECANSSTKEISRAVRDQLAATEDIAHSIVETERAAADVAGRIESVASESHAADERAEQANKICSSVAEDIRNLQTELIRILRGSSSHLDRRGETRHEFHDQAVLMVGTQRRRVTLENISLGGAKISGKFGMLGQSVQLLIPSINLTINATIAHASQDCTNLEFLANPSEREHLRHFLEQIDHVQPPRLVA